MDRDKVIEDHADDLRMFPVIDEKGDKKKTLYDWAKSYIAAGMSLDNLLSKRADADYDSRAGAGLLRSNIVGQIRRMREALADEVGANPKLSRTLVDDVFSYYDQAAADFTAKQQANKSKKAAAKKAADIEAKKSAPVDKKPEGTPADG